MKTSKMINYPFLFLLISISGKGLPQSTIPTPDHIVVLILENHDYAQIIGSLAAPFINALANDTSTALFIQSYAIVHPSQPNYLILYSGNTQNVTDDLIPADIPFSTENLGRQLIDSGKTFITYSEDLPEAGYNGASSGDYVRKHNPAANWMGTGINQVPDTVSQPFTAFPSGNFALLPAVSFVIPNQVNDMHNGTDPSRITIADDWIFNNLASYIQWAKTNNSLFILTFDEAQAISDNHIVTTFTGQMVKAGQYSGKINHYSILHTIEEMCGLPYIGDSLNYLPIEGCWKRSNALSFSADNELNNIILYPNPCKRELFVELSDYLNTTLEIYTLSGKMIRSCYLQAEKTNIKIDDLQNGLYIIKLQNKGKISIGKFVKNESW